MSNAIVKALEDGAEKLGKTLGKDAGKAVSDLYHSAGHGLEQVAKNTAEADAKHAAELYRIHHPEPSRDELRAQLGEKPVFLLHDKGKIQRLTPKGPQDLTGADRELLGVPLKLTGANKDTLPRRPKNPNNPYSWGKSTDEERAARARKPSTEVPLNEDELSRATALARHEQGSYGNYTPHKVTGQPVYTSNNYAAVRVEYDHDEGKQEFILVGRSNNPVHSEKVLGIPFLENGSGSQIKDLYTERAPCSDNSDCAAWVQKWLPHVNVTHSIEYGPSGESIARGNREIEDRLNRMYPGARPGTKSPWTNFKGLHSHK